MHDANERICGLDRVALLSLELPVIIVTGDDNEETYERAMNYGIAAYLRKPVDGQVLLDAIAFAVGPGKDNPLIEK